MAAVNPLTSALALAMDRKGKLRLLFKGVVLPGVLHIEVNQNGHETSTVQVTFSGAAVRFETEQADSS